MLERDCDNLNTLDPSINIRFFDCAWDINIVAFGLTEFCGITSQSFFVIEEVYRVE